MAASAALCPLLATAAAPAWAATPPVSGATPQPPEAAPVGLSTLRFEDPSRAAWGAPEARPQPRPVALWLWYPAAAGSVQADRQVGPFAAQRVAWQAPPAAGPRRALVLLSHGTGGSAAAMGWLARGLAAQGYVVAVPNHHGNTSAEEAPALAGFLAWWDRPLDLKLVLDRLLADAHWGPRIDPARVGAAGFSLGGTTVLALAGARPDVARWRSHCSAAPTAPGCALPPEAGRWRAEEAQALLAGGAGFGAALQRATAELREPRVRAVFALAPVLAEAVQPESLAAVRVPVALLSGSADDQALPAAVQAWGAIPGASVALLPGVTHYAFVSPCTFLARWTLPTLCRDPGGLDRAALQATTVARAGAFFDHALGRP